MTRRLPRRAFAAASALLDEGLGPIYPGASLAVRQGGALVFERAVGRLHPALPPEIRPGTRFDVASLTKPMCVATLLAQGVAEGWAALDEALADHWPEWEDSPAADVTLRELLGHRGGLPAHRPLYELLDASPRCPPGTPAARARLREAIRQTPLECEPGRRAVYSDLGYLTLGFWIEHRLEQPLTVAFQERVAGPWGLERTGYTAPASGDAPVTERCPWRGRELRGDVHDENAGAFGAACGHAGVFTSAADVAAWGGMWLKSARGAGPLAPDVVRAFWEEAPGPPAEASTWRLGFDSPSPEGSSAGARVSPAARGHLGFTGGSVWIDPAREAVVALLTNRTYPSRDHEAIRAFRPRLHDAIWAALDS